MRALIVDDDMCSLELLQDVLNQLGYEVERAINGKEALEKLRGGSVHLVITDWEMPEMNGLELCRSIRREDFDGYVFVIILTSRDGSQQRIDGLHAGADALLTKPLNPGELLVSLKTAERILGLETRDLAMFALAKLSESRDPETGSHIERVQCYARVLAQHLSTTEQYYDRIDTEFIRLIFQTSPLHDIGKVSIPDSILLKPGKLSEPEMKLMRTHARLGAKTLEASLDRFPNVRFLQMARDIAAAHHERWDGKGYPEGLAGDAIPLAARIVALADVYDALTSKRVYRDAISHAQAKGMIVAERGTHFDPDIVDAFLNIESQFIAIHERLKDNDGEPPKPQSQLTPVKPASETLSNSGDPKANILVVDDEPSIRSLLVHHLHANGLECISCENGLAALAAMEMHEIRLIISDCEMPEMNGLELCRRVRATSEGRHVHFIMLTIHAGIEDLTKSFDAGVDDFMGKPFTESEISARLRAGMRSIALHDEVSQQHQASQQLNEQLIGLNRRLERLAITDELTGLYNRRQGMQRLDEHWAVCDRYHRPVAVISIDIDHFKQINDAYGHSTGDMVLKGVADRLRECIRNTDLVCRVGGEEFLIILPFQSLQEALLCAERCRRSVAQQQFDIDGQTLRVTVSAGAASRRDGMEQCAQLLAEADAALYLAKRSGRNTVRSGRNEGQDDLQPLAG